MYTGRIKKFTAMMFCRLGRRIASKEVCIGALGWTATAMLLIAACSEGAHDRPMGEGLTPTVTQWAEPGSTPFLTATVPTATPKVQDSGYETSSRSDPSPPGNDLTVTPQLGTKPYDIIAPRTQSLPMNMAWREVSREILKTEHIEFYLGRDSVSESMLREYARHIESELSEIAEKLGINPSSAFPGGVHLTFISTESELVDYGERWHCPVRGLAFLQPFELVSPTMVRDPAPISAWIVADEETMAGQVIAVAAHELSHHVGWARFGHIEGIILVEGLATWLAQDTWLRWHGWDSLDEAVLGFLSVGTYIPFAQRDERPERASDADCLARRDTLYTEYASFVGFLIDWYGMERFEELTDTVRVITEAFDPSNRMLTLRSVLTPDPVYNLPMVDYRAVYGRSLDELEQEWLRMLMKRATGMGI